MSTLSINHHKCLYHAYKVGDNPDEFYDNNQPLVGDITKEDFRTNIADGKTIKMGACLFVGCNVHLDVPRSMTLGTRAIAAIASAKLYMEEGIDAMPVQVFNGGWILVFRENN